ncbi:MAG: SsrA-binding protein SmpB, partial [Phycisphaeraceae bacterium]|nr:SsrA-binding protein SmpB [Phycisphaeraceae bacterium]
ILESLEVGLVLQGSEVKSVRHGQVSLAEGFARIEPNTGEMFLYNVDINAYAHAQGANGHEPKRARKLLAHRRQITRLAEAVDAKGTTLVPLTMYFVRGMVKLELGVGRGKREHDKREDIKAREAKDQIRHALSRRR